MLIIHLLKMQEVNYCCNLFLLTVILLLNNWMFKGVNSHLMSFHDFYTRSSSLSYKLIQMRKMSSGISYRLDTWSQYDNPEEGTKREGDISKFLLSRKTITRNKDLLWPNGIVNYYVASSIVNEPDKFTMLEDAMNTIMAKTCIKFVRIYPDNGKFPKNGWLNVTSHEKGCFSDLGQAAHGSTLLNLDITKCFYVIGHAIHEMLHVLGVYHEHMRPDRDDYIIIEWNNIKDGEAFNFYILDNDTVTTYGLPYDYDSIMHYAMTAFSRNRSLPTIIPKVLDVEIGQRDHLSHYDIQKLLIAYNCSSNTTFK